MLPSEPHTGSKIAGHTAGQPEQTRLLQCSKRCSKMLKKMLFLRLPCRKNWSYEVLLAAPNKLALKPKSWYKFETKLKELGAYNHIEILGKVPQNGEVALPDVVFPQYGGIHCWQLCAHNHIEVVPTWSVYLMCCSHNLVAYTPQCCILPMCHLRTPSTCLLRRTINMLMIKNNALVSNDNHGLYISPKKSINLKSWHYKVYLKWH